MLLPVLAALTCGGFAGTFALWAFGFAGASNSGATARLNKLRNGDITAPSATSASSASMFKMRRPKAVNLGGMTLVSGKVSANWSKQLERAGLSLNAREYLIMRLTIAAVAGVAALVLTPFPVPFPLAGVVAAPIGFIAPSFYVKFRSGARLAKLETQLIEMLQMLSSGLRAGFGLQQALEASSEQIPDPLATEIRRCIRDISMGASVEQALTALNDRVGSPDFDIVITAILIQRTVGGNLAEILDNVAHTMRERERIRGEIKTLTSQQRLTGIVLGGVPFGLLVVMFLINRDFIMLLFTENLGRAMLGAGLFLEILGALVIKKIVNIEV